MRPSRVYYVINDHPNVSIIQSISKLKIEDELLYIKGNFHHTSTCIETNVHLVMGYFSFNASPRKKTNLPKQHSYLLFSVSSEARLAKISYWKVYIFVTWQQDSYIDALTWSIVYTRTSLQKCKIVTNFLINHNLGSKFYNKYKDAIKK